MIHEAHFTLEKIEHLLRMVEAHTIRAEWSLPPFNYLLFPAGHTMEVADAKAALTSGQPIQPFEYWGEWNRDFVLAASFALPESLCKLPDLEFWLPLGEAGDFSHPEALARVDGRRFGACDRHHQEIDLPAEWQDGRAHCLSLHGWSGLGGEIFSKPGKLQMRPCKVVQIDPQVRGFVAVVRVALASIRKMEVNEPARAHLLNILDETFKLLDLREGQPGAFSASLPSAQVCLAQGLKDAGQPLDVDLFATGHAHIDVAWLWPLAVTRQKALRTFTNAVNLLEKNPLFHFSQSQPQLYEYIRQDAPDLFAHIQKLVAAGRWEVLGGMWLEADCNLSGAESLARQFLLGRSYFERYFGSGSESPVLWLPDAFGFCWSLPQLIREAGLKYFFTIKLSWNQTNRLPYDSFWWQGLDGSRVLAHFSTTPSVGSEWKASTYNAEVEPGQVMDSWRNFQQKELHPNLLMAYGFGDGGGGPTREMTENLQVLQAFPAMPKLHSASVGDFYRRLEEQDGANLPVWNGELYLELHRGTYTSQSRNKRANRKSEFALHDSEFLASLAATLSPAYQYPHQQLNQAWQTICLNQFHDILPGSSIQQVYEESQQQYREVLTAAEDVSSAALDAINACLSDAAGAGKGALWLVNPTGFSRNDPVFYAGSLPADGHFVRADGVQVNAQSSGQGTWLDAGPLPPYSLTALELAQGALAPAKTGLHASEHCLENELLRVELNSNGDITRIYDKANQREVLSVGALADEFLAFEDRPVNWDAWDLDPTYSDRVTRCEAASSVKVVEAGPLHATLEIRRKIQHSPFVKRISLACNSARLDFSVSIDWQEKHTLLKTAFPVQVFSPQATYEIQWGNLQRPTHQNTSWDRARFETVAHKWVDLSEGDYGVSLLNDCKFGHDIHDNVIRLSLLRSPTEPDAHADEGEHTFAYSLFPHAGSWDERTIGAAYALNDPARVVPSAGKPKRAAYSLFAVDQPNVVIETIKAAEDGNGWIVRLYESQRCRRNVTLQAGFDPRKAWRTNLLEENQEELAVTGNRVSFKIMPYQIVTLRIM